jgi:hypothetical protein
LALAELLLKHALPHLVGHVEGRGADWRTGRVTRSLLDSLASTADAASLQPALRRHMLRPGAAAFLQQVARVVKAVPLEVPEGVPAEILADAHHNTAKLLGDMCLLLSSTTGEPGSQAGASSTAAQKRPQERSSRPDGKSLGSCRIWRQ